MEIITYSLAGVHSNSDHFYKNLSIFTDEAMNQVDDLAKQIIKEYMDYVETYKIEKLRKHEEYAIEYLTLGVLWQVYSCDALGLPDLPKHILIGLYDLRQQGGSLKPGADFLRGILATMFLSPNLYDNVNILDPNLNHLDKLIDWLSATGDFSQEVKRLKPWREFLFTKSTQNSTDYLATAITLAAWFEARSDEALGQFTGNVDNYLNNIRPTRYWMEDVIFCGRRKVEYHLNMLGAEVMNRAYREEFLKAPKKAVLLPSCMCRLPEELCQACDASMGKECTGCTKECIVNFLTEMGKQHNFQVLIMSHESSIFPKGKVDNVEESSVGIVGIACVLNLLSGGWKLKALDIPAQCVLLEYCGCKKHWHKEGFPTRININQFKKVMDIK